MKIKIDLSKSPHECCPSFDVCMDNKCPLHKDYIKLENKPDKEIKGWKRCRATKSTRMKIAKAFKLKNMGLTLRELSAMKKSLEMKKQSFLLRNKTTNNALNNTRGEVLG